MNSFNEENYDGRIILACDGTSSGSSAASETDITGIADYKEQEHATTATTTTKSTTKLRATITEAGI